ncbi:hypothetical protein BC835DRAFT_421018 [Cytidiella melzeri]|nr:hypothetical protein BC835DRAFT_421018 [Cytidiella melzeri]
MSHGSSHCKPRYKQTAQPTGRRIQEQHHRAGLLDPSRTTTYHDERTNDGADMGGACAVSLDLGCLRSATYARPARWTASAVEQPAPVVTVTTAGSLPAFRGPKNKPHVRRVPIVAANTVAKNGTILNSFKFGLNTTTRPSHTPLSPIKLNARTPRKNQTVKVIKPVFDHLRKKKQGRE